MRLAVRGVVGVEAERCWKTRERAKESLGTADIYLAYEVVMECPVCFTPYSLEAVPPLVLSCGHTFCKSCLSQLPKADSLMACPSCRKSTKCSSIDEISINYSILDTIRPAEESKDEECCPLHEHKKVKFYCQKCESYFCTKCVVLHTSAEHQIVAVQLFMDQKLQTEALRLSKATEKTQSSFDEAGKALENLQNKRNAVEAAYQEAAERLQQEKESRLQLLDGLLAELSTSISQFQACKDQSTQLSAELFQAQHSQSSLKAKKALLGRAAVQKCPDLSTAAGLEIKMLQLPAEGLIQVRRKPVRTVRAMDVQVLETRKSETQPAIWQFFNNRGLWISYNVEASTQVERAFKAGLKELTVGYYRVNLVNFCQSNVKTGFERPVRRVLA